MPRVIHRDLSRGFINMCHITHSYGCHDSFIWVPWLIHMGAMTHSYRRHDSFICVPWLILIGAMTHSHIGAMTHSSAWTFMYDPRPLVWFRFWISQHRHADLCYIYVSCRKSRFLVWFPVETVSTENATTPKSTKSSNSDSSVSQSTNSNWEFSGIWVCTEKFGYRYLVDFGSVAFAVESVTPGVTDSCHE